ncbi:MAG: hypothetical protein OEO21_05285 [Candidatus Krumholzibacteria bacterium]|nr:hypothetical protein [Candidatus Krumholzibacteria bacterium]
MIPNPLHPAVVHFPIVLATFLPLIALIVLGPMRGNRAKPRAWGVVVSLCAFLAVSAWVAVWTGSKQADRVEQVVAEQHVEAHEEAAEYFAVGSLVVLALSALGLVAGGWGMVGRSLTLLLSVVLLAMVVRVGDLGGKLVYQHGAAQVYVESSGQVDNTMQPGAADRTEDDD